MPTFYLQPLHCQALLPLAPPGARLTPLAAQPMIAPTDRSPAHGPHPGAQRPATRFLRGALAMTIRQATEDDATLLAAIIRDSFLTVAQRLGFDPATVPRHSSNCTPEWVRQQLDEGTTFYILEREGAPCACVALEQREDHAYYFKRLAVLPPYRRQGFGGALVRHVTAQAQARGARRLELATLAEVPHLRAWYERLGFRHKETTSFPHLPFTLVFMYKDLL